MEDVSYGKKVCYAGKFDWPEWVALPSQLPMNWTSLTLNKVKQTELFIQVLKETDLQAKRNGIHWEVSSQAAVLSITTLIEIICFVYSKS